MKPKAPKTIIHEPILHTISSSPASFKHNGLWSPSPSEYRASEVGFVPKKIRVSKKKNPFKMLEMLAEAQAEGHELRPHFVKKVKPDSSFEADSSQTSEFLPDYMLVDNPHHGGPYGSEESSSDSSSGAKSDIIYLAPGHDKFRKRGFVPSREFAAPTTASKKKLKMPHDWIPSSVSSSIYEPEPRVIRAPKKFKSRKPKRLASIPTLSPVEAHISMLQHRAASLPNFTRIKNRLHATSSLNTSI